MPANNSSLVMTKLARELILSLSPAQKRRLLQVLYQGDPLTALLTASVYKALHFTGPQLAAMKKVQVEFDRVEYPAGPVFTTKGDHEDIDRGGPIIDDWDASNSRIVSREALLISDKGAEGRMAAARGRPF